MASDDNDDGQSAKAPVAALHADQTSDLRSEVRTMGKLPEDDTVKDTIGSLKERFEALKPRNAQPEADSRFFSLPAEIRNYVYELCIFGDHGGWRVVIDEREKKSWEGGPRSAYASKVHSAKRSKGEPAGPEGVPSLLHTSRQIRSEALPMFLTHVTIIAGLDRYLPPGHAKSIAFPWLTNLGPEQVHSAPVTKAWLIALGPEHAKLIGKFVLTVDWRYGMKRPNKDFLALLGLDKFGMKAEAMSIWEYDETRTRFDGHKWHQR